MVRHVFDLNAVVNDVRPLLAHLIGEHIELVVSLARTRLYVEADPTQLQQTIINLATNARDAMPDGGTLTIATELVDGVPTAQRFPRAVTSRSACRDTGIGMDAATRRLAFDPFFTTKDVGTGTGLGLASVYGIVEQSGGHVHVGVGAGARKLFPRLPSLGRRRDDEASDIPAAATAPPAGSAHPATIVLVEDETLVREITARSSGARELCRARSAGREEALRIVRRHAGQIDLVITDVVMARLGGLELARRWRTSGRAFRSC